MAAAIVKKVKACLEQNVFKVLSDETFLKLYYRFFIGRKLDLDHPQGYKSGIYPSCR